MIKVGVFDIDSARGICSVCAFSSSLSCPSGKGDEKIEQFPQVERANVKTGIIKVYSCRNFMLKKREKEVAKRKKIIFNSQTRSFEFKK